MSNETIRVLLADDHAMVREGLATALVPQRAAETARSRFRTLGEREQTVLQRVAEGYSGAEIARQLGIRTKTVDA